jgi:hypothetical protein
MRSVPRLGFGLWRFLGHAASGARQLDEKIAVMVRLRPLRHADALCGALAELLQHHLEPPMIDNSDKRIPTGAKSSMLDRPKSRTSEAPASRAATFKGGSNIPLA